MNGLKDVGEPGVANIVVDLYWATNGSFIAQTTTNATGYYLFCGLYPGQYKVAFTINTTVYAYTPFFQVGNGTNPLWSDVNAATTSGAFGVTPIINLNPSQNNLIANAGIVPLSCLGSLVWLDNNTNGIYEVNENKQIRKTGTINKIN